MTFPLIKTGQLFHNKLISGFLPDGWWQDPFSVGEGYPQALPEPSDTGNSETVIVNADINPKQIGRLYTAAFGRKPDAGGLQYWVNEVNDPLVSYKDVSKNFVDSVEFSKIAPADSSSDIFTTALYQNVLGREPDSSGLSYWTNELDTGLQDRSDVLIGFANSPENIALYETLA